LLLLLLIFLERPTDCSLPVYSVPMLTVIILATRHP
jgi:hypothetical protein